MNPAHGHDQYRVQLWSGFYKTTWASYGRYGDAHTSRFVRPLAGRATLISIDELVLVAQNVRAGAAAASVVGFCRWPRRTAGRGLGRLSRFGDGVDQSVVAALVASGMRRAGSTGRDRVTGIAATTTPRRNGENGDEAGKPRERTAEPRSSGERPRTRPRENAEGQRRSAHSGMEAKPERPPTAQGDPESGSTGRSRSIPPSISERHRPCHRPRVDGNGPTDKNPLGSG